MIHFARPYLTRLSADLCRHLCHSSALQAVHAQDANLGSGIYAFSLEASPGRLSDRGHWKFHRTGYWPTTCWRKLMTSRTGGAPYKRLYSRLN